MKIFYLL